MTIHSRHIELLLEQDKNLFKVVLLSGARQVGKTTILRHTQQQAQRITFQPLQDVHNARKQPDAFLKKFEPPLILDEVQYVPELLASLKCYVDEREEKGMYFLSGSQNLSLLKTVSESMVGRVGTLFMEHMSLLEIANIASEPRHNWLPLYLEKPSKFRLHAFDMLADYELFETVWRGGFPGLLNNESAAIPRFFMSYVHTYIERDVRTMSSLRNIDKFESFLRLCAILSSQEVNYSQLGRELGLTNVSAQEWTNLLKQSFQWRAVQPYFANEIKRVARKPKGYITDTGLLCYLLNIQNPKDLADHSSRGAIFETWVVNYIHQLATQMPAKPGIYHWRSLDGGEVDIVLDYGGRLYPIEVKLTKSLRSHDLRGIQSFRRAFAGRQIAPALIIYGGTEPYAIDENTFALPWNAYCVP